MPKPMTAHEAESLLPYCSTEKQRETLKLIAKHGGIRATQRAIGHDPDNGIIPNMVARIKARAATQGYSPEHDYNFPVPNTHIAKGVSILYDEDGKPTQTWVKSDLDREERERLILEAIDGLKDEIPKAKKIAAPRKKGQPELCNQYLITDYHLGMKAWHEEAGDDWDMRIAEDLLLAWFAEAVRSAPEAEQAIFAQLGDFLHFDSLEAVTPTNRNILDADTRYQKMVRVAIRVLRACAQMLLEKHQRVHIIMADANHDPAGSAWLREAFAVFYEKEPRVTVDVSPDTFYAYQWGETALFWHHGHKVKPEKLAEVFAAKFREMFGATKHAYGHAGHQHHKIVVENTLMPIEQHRTLAAKDAYSSGHGYMAGRDAAVITYHKRWGEVGRVVISPDMVRAA